MESELSSNCLFHFTKSLDNIKNILTKGFYPRACKEDYSFLFTEVPKEEAYYRWGMVCFCDMPKNLQRRHRERYGDYGIALSKEWGISKGICPLMYIPLETNGIRTLEQLASQIKGLFSLSVKARDGCLMEEKTKEELIGCTEEILGNFIQFMGYWKLYEEGGVRYYDEREWRYLCPWTTQKQIQNQDSNVLNGKDVDDEKKIKRLNDALKRQPLCFSMEDIDMIIVPTKDDYSSLVDFLRNRDNQQLNQRLSWESDTMEKLIEKIEIG